MDSESQARDMISSWIADILSDLAIIAECLRQIDLYQPWANSFEDLLVDRKENIQAEFAKSTAPWGKIMTIFSSKGPNASILAKLGAPVDGKFYYPSDKRRSEENTKAMQRAEENLDLFWSKVDDQLQRSPGGFDDLAIKSVFGERILQRTPDYIESSKPQPDINADAFKPLSEIYFDLQRRTESTQTPGESLRTAKSKPKTRGVALAPTEPVDNAQREAIEREPAPIFEVDQKSLKVFKTLFYTPSLSGTPGDVSWTDFLHALNYVGLAPEKLYGSVWQFSPKTNLAVERSIQFHQPHPNPKIPYRVARRYGRRLNRAYGWHSSNFALQCKTNA